MRKFFSYLMVALKGACMGAADVIPGVSGGTIAFITGIYEKLIGSIKSFDGVALKMLFKGEFKDLWNRVNGGFLLSLFAGIIISILSLAKVMQHLLNHYPIETWAFFFGLIVASALFILRGVGNWKFKDVVLLLIGVAAGVIICTLRPTSTPEDIWFIVICGSIAICAMILPGISGSFILLILGKYKYLMEVISKVVDGVDLGKNILILVAFGVGAIVGIIAFSKFLHWLLSRYNRQTLITLAGFILGSLVVVWPWANRGTILLSQSHLLEVFDGGKLAAAAQQGDIPSDLINWLWPNVDLHIGGAVLFCLLGLSLVFAIEIIGKVASKKSEKNCSNQ